MKEHHEVPLYRSRKGRMTFRLARLAHLYVYFYMTRILGFDPRIKELDQ